MMVGMLVLFLVSAALLLAFVVVIIAIHVVRGRRPLPPANVSNLSDYRRPAADRTPPHERSSRS